MVLSSRARRSVVLGVRCSVLWRCSIRRREPRGAHRATRFRRTRGVLRAMKRSRFSDNEEVEIFGIRGVLQSQRGTASKSYATHGYHRGDDGGKAIDEALYLRPARPPAECENCSRFHDRRCMPRGASYDGR